MSFEDKLKSLAAKAESTAKLLETEEATKNALVMPFIAALGYDVFDPTEVVPEFTDGKSGAMHTIWPSLIVQQTVNSLAVRHAVPRGPGVTSPRSKCFRLTLRRVSLSCSTS